MNMRNFGLVEGRVTKNPVIFTNADGSRKIMLTVAAQDNFTDKEGKRNTQFVNLEGFVPASKNTNGVFDYIHKGDLIGVEYTVRTNNYTAKSGEEVYSQVLFIQLIDLKESKATTDARAAKNAEPSEEIEEPVPAPELPVVEETVAKKPAKKAKKAKPVMDNIEPVPDSPITDDIEPVPYAEDLPFNE